MIRHDPVRDRKLVARWNAGRTIPDLMAEFSLTYYGVQAIKRRMRARGHHVRVPNGQPAEWMPKDPARARAIIKAWNEAGDDVGLTEIGEEWGMPRASVARLLSEARAAGWEVRAADYTEAQRRGMLVRKAGREKPPGPDGPGGWSGGCD